MGIPTRDTVIHPHATHRKLAPRRKLAVAGLALAAASAVTGAVLTEAGPASAPGTSAASLVAERSAHAATGSRSDLRQPLAGGYPTIAAPSEAASASPSATTATSPPETPASTPATSAPQPPASAAAPSERRTPSRASRSRSSSAGGTVLSSGACVASYYDEGQQTASGEAFDPNAFTAAHRTLPLGSRVRVINARSGASVVVRINDRGPYVSGRCLDLSRAAFEAIASLGAGTASVRYEVLSRG